MVTLIIGIICLLLGAAWREIYHLSKRPEPKEKTSGAVTPSYNRPSETKQSSIVARPKTPQQMEAIANERMRKNVLGL